MYIGPWQEYKLAQVIRVKNDLYEGNSHNQILRHTNTQENISISQGSNVSTPSTRTLSSEPVQKPYPKFAIDQYYEQWRKVENILSQPAEVHKKPPLPKVQVRKRQGRSIQEKRVNRMRVLYGFNKPNAEVLSNENQKVSFVDKLKNKVKDSETLTDSPVNKINDELNRASSKASRKGDEKVEEIKIVQRKDDEKTGKMSVEDGKEVIDLRSKDRWQLRISTLRENFEEVKEKNEVKVEEVDKKFTCLASINEMDALEESINHDAVDGLLQWVDNLPDEASSTLRELSSQESKFQGIKI